jgi:transposase
MSIVKTYVGLDYHEDTVRVCILDQTGKMLLNRDLPNSVPKVATAIHYFGIPGKVGIEACCGAADFATKLATAGGFPVTMAHAGAVAKLKQGKDKTDHGDAWLLADLSRVNYLPEVWIADAQTRQLRRLVRYRESIVESRKNTKLRIRALLREERVTQPQNRPWTKAWLAWLTNVELGEQSRWVMDQLLAELQHDEQRIQNTEQRMVTATQGDAICERLLQEPGVGLITAITLRAEIGHFGRFRNGKQLARFCGVTPRNASSGKRQADAGLSCESNKNLRRVIIQAAQRLPRCDERWKTMKQHLRQTKHANVATAAIANRWIRALYHVMKEILPGDDLLAEQAA